MRAQLLEAMDHRDDLAAIDDDFLHLFSSWFNRGFLVLRTHRLVDAGEPAGEDHPLRGGARDPRLERSARAASIRRTGAATPSSTPQLVDEPLIFVEVALTRGIPAAIDADPVRQSASRMRTRARDDGGVLFDLELPARARRRLVRPFPDQAGGRGGAVAKSRGCRPSSRLSPAPNFAEWLKRERASEASLALSDEDRALLAALDRAGLVAAMRSTAETCASRCCARRRGTTCARARRAAQPLDSVARFHLGNGARLERLNFARRHVRAGAARNRTV